jgi:hypothetical protein
LHHSKIWHAFFNYPFKELMMNQAPDGKNEPQEETMNLVAVRNPDEIFIERPFSINPDNHPVNGNSAPDDEDEDDDEEGDEEDLILGDEEAEGDEEEYDVELDEDFDEKDIDEDDLVIDSDDDIEDDEDDDL